MKEYSRLVKQTTEKNEVFLTSVISKNKSANMDRVVDRVMDRRAMDRKQKKYFPLQKIFQLFFQ